MGLMVKHPVFMNSENLEGVAVLAIYSGSGHVKREVCMVKWLGEYENKGTRDDICYETPKWVES